jgi:hypothetical protein
LIAVIREAVTSAVDEDAALAPRRALPHVSDVLLPLSAILWAVGVARTNTSRLGGYGLPAVLPIVFYAGVALLVISVAFELARPALTPARMAIHAVVLVVMLYGTAPLVYQQSRYPWVYKTVGVIQYVSAHHQLDRQIDIYQNWPGFFALAAWFDKVAGVSSPLVYAKWAQLFFELAALPLLYLAYRTLALPARQRWIALFIYSGSNWIGQDYLSPQAMGTLLSITIIAIALRYMYVGNSAGQRLRLWRLAREPDEPLFAVTRRTIGPFLVMATLYVVIVFSHQISPYIVVVQLGILAVTGLLRPRWVPVALLAIALAYLLPRFDFVETHFGILSSIGQFFRNVRPPRIDAAAAIPLSQKRLNEIAEVLSIGIWLLALAGAWVRRRSRRTVIALLILAFSPVLVLAGVAYGNEAILRVYLFSLPWAAALAAAALSPVGVRTRRGTRHGAGDEVSLRTSIRRWLPPGALRTPLVLAVILALFFPAFFGGDSYETMSTSQVDAVTSFMQSAPPGPVFVPVDDTAFPDTARYNKFPVAVIFGFGGVLNTHPATWKIASTLAYKADQYTGGNVAAYVLVTPSMEAYNNSNPVAKPGSFQILLNSLSKSLIWEKVFDHDGTFIYELPPGLELGKAPPSNTARALFWIP